VELNSGTTTIGRAADNDVVIDNPGVSALHATIVHDQVKDIFYVEDANSTNGIFVNGQRTMRQQLKFGDEITILKHKLKFKRVDFSDKVSNPAPVQIAPAISQGRTVEIDTAQVQAIMKEYQKRSAYLLQTSGGNRGKKFMLSNQRISIGKAANCDIRISGWFAPKLAATIMGESDGCYLIPEKRGKVRVNNVKVTGHYELLNLDHIEVGGVKLTFYASPTGFAQT
jgi:predicted component of type VI protein secretion system